MGKIKHRDKIRELFSKSPVVDFASVARIVGDKGYAKMLINNLARRGEIRRLAKGFYTIHDDISLAVFCYKPAYLGLQSALSLHGLWGQETIPIILTAKKARTGIRRISGGNVQIRHIDGRHLFGFSQLKDGDIYLPYSDIEKTLIDMVVFRQKIPEEALKIKFDRKKLETYLRKYSARTRKRFTDIMKTRI